MTAKEFLANKCRIEIEKVLKKNNLSFKFEINSTKTYWDIPLVSENSFGFLRFDMEKGVINVHCGHLDLDINLEELIKEINSATAFYRLYASKNFSTKDLQDIFGEDLEVPEFEKSEIKNPKADDLENHPLEISTKGIRIKIKDYSYRSGGKTIAFKTKPVLAGTRLDITATVNEGVVHSSELTFLTPEDADSFIKNRPDFFSQFDMDDVYLSNAHLFDLVRVPVNGSDYAYATKKYISWRSREGRETPQFS